MTVRLPRIDRERLERHRIELEGSLCRDSLADHVRRGWHVYEPNGRPFIPNMGTDAIIEHLQAVADGVIRKLAVAVSPGFGKTTLCSIAYPAFRWTRNPAWRVLCGSHAHKLATDIGRKFLRVVSSDWYRTRFPQVEIDSDAVDKITTARTGIRYAVGTEGAVTGFRANAGIIDDSLNAIDATSKLAIARVNDWFDNALSTRFDDGLDAEMVVIQQCLAENDLIARCRELGYEMLVLPARYEVGRKCVTSIWEDPRAEDGQILAPEIHSSEFLDRQLQILRAHGFAAQYQQRPAPREGNRFKVGDWNWCSLGAVEAARRPSGARENPPYVIERRRDGSLDLDVVCVSVDASGGSRADGASALGLVSWARKAERRFILHDATPGPRTFLETIDDIRAALQMTVRICGKQPRIVLLIEHKALGEGAASLLEKAVGDGKLLDYDDRPIVARIRRFEPRPHGDKEQRAATLEPLVDAGLYYLLDGAPWVPAFLDEFATFPLGARDDRVDAVSQAELEHRATDARSRWKVLSS